MFERMGLFGAETVTHLNLQTSKTEPKDDQLAS